MDIQTMSGASEFQFDEAKLPGIEWLAEQMPQGFFICSAKEPGEILYINRAACRMFGCSDADDFKINIGTTFFDMVHPDDLAKTRSTMDAQAEGNAAHRMDHVQYRIVRKDGEVRTVEDHGHPANFRGAGEVYCVFIGDITARRGIEEEKKRGSKLAYALEAQKEANVAKTAFLSNMSHEIRTPITAILGMNDIIRRESRDDQVLTYSDNIRKA
ncbi:MAG: PAS domain S-box protein, partial [Lachnospiraceae bacterium]|nr:PAS domain S-box protein [Lachnospiraceae bacterium]